jgi:chromatin remodeling complex protein RSC6
MQKLSPSPELSQVIGSAPVSRGQAIKKVWDYIKKKGLQDPANKRNIVVDEKLDMLFPKKKKISMFDLAKGVSRNLKK